MSIVIDASVALKWVLDESGSAAAEKLRDEELIAPVLWLAEASNALWRGVRVGQLGGEEATELLLELMGAPIATLPMEPHLAHALHLATQLDHPIYDCIYLALALRHETHVVTADRRFAAAAGSSAFADRVRLLGS